MKNILAIANREVRAYFVTPVGWMCMFGFMGAVARYAAAEQVPVATDAINDLAEGTQDAVKTVARSVAEGVKEAQAEDSK